MKETPWSTLICLMERAAGKLSIGTQLTTGIPVRACSAGDFLIMVAERIADRMDDHKCETQIC
jgi:hypothetical protein